jgi:pyrroloquinoline quinone (PQQ) biosynthesis protein C
MTTQADTQTRAADAAAKAREVLAERIAKLTRGVEDDEHAQVILHLAEAYGHLAAEPPRARAT